MAIKSTASRMPTVACVHIAHLPSSLRQPPDQQPAADDIRSLFGAARRVRAELRMRPAYQPLRGKNLALLTARPPGVESALLQVAATQLGARVALVRYVHRADGQLRDVEALAGTLGRMYDAIDCESLPEPVAQRIAGCAGLPVTEGLGSDRHRACALADLMTLHEQPLPPRAALSICLLGDADNPRARHFLAAARGIGFVVQPVDATFVANATQPGRWTLWALGTKLDDATRADNHLRLVQAVLLREIAGLRVSGTGPVGSPAARHWTSESPSGPAHLGAAAPRHGGSTGS